MSQNTEIKSLDDLSMYEEYFYLTEKHKLEQGERTIVLLNCGVFYEMYGYYLNGTISGSDISEICNICDLACTEKTKIKYKNKTLFQAGFRDFVTDKYVNIIIEAGYTAVLYSQSDEINIKTKKLIRKLEAIYSAGTYISTESSETKLNNHIMTLWIEKGVFRQKSGNKKNCIAYGFSLLNVFNGKTYMFEQMTQDEKIQSTTFDDLEKNISIFRPNEIVFISNLPNTTMKTIEQYTGIGHGDPTIHYCDFEKEDVKNCMKQTYIRHILTQQFGDSSWESCEEFHLYPYAVQSFCYLLHFIKCRNANLIKHIQSPIFQNKSNTSVLANHTLRQLNILLDQSENKTKYGHLSSVGSFLNKCVTVMGKRKMQYILTHPTFDEVWLTKEYEAMNTMLQPNQQCMVEPLRKQIGKIKDLEKLGKLLLNRKITPDIIYQLYESITISQQVQICFSELPSIQKYLMDGTNVSVDAIETQYKKIIRFLDSKLLINVCKTSTQKTTFDENIIQPGVSKYLDDTLDQLKKREEQIKTIETFFNQLYNELSSLKKNSDIVKLNQTEKSSMTLQITKTRSDLLKRGCKLTHISLENDVQFDWSDVVFSSTNKTNNEISFPLLNTICKDIYKIKNEMNTIIHDVFLGILTELEETYYSSIETISAYISNLDVLLSKCYIAYTYKYNCPTISQDETIKESFIEATDMRHILIEHLQQDEVYVTNDVTLGTKDVKGILLYGTNAVGKTSYIKAIGICTIMAQAGMFVPCKTFHYKPFTAIYSRILGNDNLFKGLSTYAVEISELRTILTRADDRSLVLGDELCSGTEVVSALSIVMASLMALYKKRTSFILASHFHELVEYDEMKQLDTVKLKHMEVWYDQDTDSLVYDRKLKDGSGQRTYGLEVCKSLYLPESVLTQAYEIRKKYHPEFQGVLSHKVTQYNTKKVKDACELCGSNDQLEIHHLQEQHKADEQGFIDGHFHKNHPGNLLTLCEKCHDSFHHPGSNSPLSPLSNTSNENTARSSVRKIVKRKTTNGYVIQEV